MALDPNRAQHLDQVIRQLPDWLQELGTAPSYLRKGHPSIPKAPGIYLFSEAGEPLYVGQTRNLRRRLADHANPSGGHNKATFAFLLARDGAEHKAAETRPELESRLQHPFAEAKDRVSRMDVQFIEMDDPIGRTVFEVYAVLHLGTERYNSFETH